MSTPARTTHLREWASFRIWMPYMCVYNSVKKQVWFANRDYKPIGISKEQLHWAKYPEEDMDHETHLYNDGTKPLSTRASLAMYIKALEMFSDYRVITGVNETIPFDLRTAIAQLKLINF